MSTKISIEDILKAGVESSYWRYGVANSNSCIVIFQHKSENVCMGKIRNLADSYGFQEFILYDIRVFFSLLKPFSSQIHVNIRHDHKLRA